jgi:hypothetical protein
LQNNTASVATGLLALEGVIVPVEALQAPVTGVAIIAGLAELLAVLAAGAAFILIRIAYNSTAGGAAAASTERVLH